MPRNRKSSASDRQPRPDRGGARCTAVQRGDGPRHVAIIMDGNGRWAAKRGLPRVAGHRAGAEAVRKTLKAAAKAGVEVLTLYAFSSENWRRSEEEVSDLKGLLGYYLERELDELQPGRRAAAPDRRPPGVRAAAGRAARASGRADRRQRPADPGRRAQLWRAGAKSPARRGGWQRRRRLARSNPRRSTRHGSARS